MRRLHARSPREYPIGRMCRLSGVSSQPYHRQKGAGAMRKAAQEAFALEVVHRVRAVDPMIGGKKLWRIYLREITGGDRMGRDRFEGVLSRHGLTIRRRVRRPRTTDSRHGLRTYPNLVYSLIPERIIQVWVSDITYVPLWTSETEYTFCYMSLVTDAYSHELIGWAVGETLEAEYLAQAPRTATQGTTRLPRG